MNEAIKLHIINFTVIILSVFFIVVSLLYENYNNKPIYLALDDISFNYITDRVEVYSKVMVSDLIKIDEYKLIDSRVDTSKIGKKTVSFSMTNGQRTMISSFDIEIIDTSAPYIDLGSTYQVEVNSDIDLLKSIMCIDNYSTSITSYIEGDYSLVKAGSYNLKYVAIDESNNINSKEFKLIVKEKNSNTTSSNTNNYYFSDAYKKYKKDNTLIGIDVSKWQGEIDFAKIKEAGVEFIMIRLGNQNGIHGENVIDKYFYKNIEGAIANGIAVGVYYYSYASDVNEALEQARFVQSKLLPYKEYVTLPIAFDFECFKLLNSFNLSMYKLSEISSKFMDTLNENGYSTLLYGSRNYLLNVWQYNDKDVWLAHYTDVTNYNGKYKMWQFSNTGVIDGIDGHVDMDIYYKG